MEMKFTLWSAPLVEAMSDLSEDTLFKVLVNAVIEKPVMKGVVRYEFREDKERIYELIYTILIIKYRWKVRYIDSEIRKRIHRSKTWLDLVYAGRGESVHLIREIPDPKTGTFKYKHGIGLNDYDEIGTGIILDSFNVYTSDQGDDWDEYKLVKVNPFNGATVPQIKKALLDSFERTIVSDYDCTGKTFGGAYKAYQIDDVHNVWMVETHYGIDI